MASRYELVVYWSDEDQAYVVAVPELPGCMAHADTREEAVAEAEEAIQLWLDTCREVARPVPEAKGRRLTLEEMLRPPPPREHAA